MRPNGSVGILLILIVGLLGCSGGPNNPETFPVSGTVTYQDAPVEGATVIFVPQDLTKKGATATTDAQGKFELTTFVSGDGARPGEYKIKVFKFDINTAPGGDVAPDATLEEEAESYDPSASSKPKEPKNLLPIKYQTEQSSGLSHTVVDQPTTIEIVLE